MTLNEFLEVFCDTEATDLRDRVFAWLPLASDCQGKESELVDYNLSRPALFFAFLAYLKPTNITRMAAALHEALRVRRIELIKFWASVTPESYQKTTFAMEKLAFEYILEITAYYESATTRSDSLGLPGEADIKLPSETKDFIARSYLAMGQEGAAKLEKYRLLPIAGTDYAIIVQPTLFGSRFMCICTSVDDEELYNGRSYTMYAPKYTVEEAWKYMILPTQVLLRPNEFTYEKKSIDQIKDSVAKNYGPEALKPSIDLACFALHDLNLDNTGTYLQRCLVDCRYILTTLYEYKLLRPGEATITSS